MWGCYRRVEELTETIRYLNHKIKTLRSKQGLKGSNYDRIIVSGGVRANTQEDICLQICECELDLEKAQQELAVELEHTKKIEEIAEQYGDKTMAVIKLKAKGLYNWQVAEQLGVSCRTIDRITSKIKE